MEKKIKKKGKGRGKWEKRLLSTSFSDTRGG